MTTENGIDRTIVEWWQATEALTDLVPVDRVATEIMQTDEAIAEDDDGDLIFDDCVVLELPPNRTGGQTQSEAIKRQSHLPQ